MPVRTDRFAKSVYGRSYVPDLTIAACKTGKDTCQGDRGGPMFKKSNGAFYQLGITKLGITSFGAGCGAPGHPGVYTEVNSQPIKSFITKAARR